MTKNAAVRLRRSPVALLAVVLGGLAVLLSVGAPAGADAMPSGFSPAHGGSKTPFEIGPHAPHCTGSASVESAYVFPLSVDPGSASWAAPNQPNGGYRPFVSSASTPRPAFRLAGMPLKPGIYHVGVTCLVPVGSRNHARGARLAAAKGSTKDTLIAITASAKDPNGFTWSVCTTPPAQLAEAPVALALPLVGVVVAGGFVAVRRRRARLRQSHAARTR